MKQVRSLPDLYNRCQSWSVTHEGNCSHEPLGFAASLHHWTPCISSTLCKHIYTPTLSLPFFCFLLPFSCCRHHPDRLQIFFQNTSSLSGLISSIIIPNGSPSLLSLPEGSFPQVSLQGSPTLMLHFTPAPKTPLLNCF